MCCTPGKQGRDFCTDAVCFSKGKAHNAHVKKSYQSNSRLWRVPRKGKRGGHTWEATWAGVSKRACLRTNTWAVSCLWHGKSPRGGLGTIRGRQSVNGQRWVRGQRSQDGKEPVAGATAVGRTGRQAGPQVLGGPSARNCWQVWSRRIDMLRVFVMSSVFQTLPCLGWGEFIGWSHKRRREKFRKFCVSNVTPQKSCIETQSSG